MIQAGEDACFLIELLPIGVQLIPIERAQGQHLFDGAQTPGQAEVFGLVHRAHAALADELQDFVAFAQNRAGGK